jgi:acyl-CoA-dependent ceramide synthase
MYFGKFLLRGTFRKKLVPTVLTFAGICLALLAPLLLAQCTTITQPLTAKFTTLSYFNEETGEYGVGFKDNYLVAVLIVALTGLRDATMRFVLAPITTACGLGRDKSTRFKEQAWLFIYYSTCWSVGMVSSSCSSPKRICVLTFLVHLRHVFILA